MFDKVLSANGIAVFLDLTSVTASGNIYSLTHSKLVAISEIIRIEVRENPRRELRGTSILESCRDWKVCGVEKWRGIVKSFEFEQVLMIQCKINASKIRGKLQRTTEMGHEYST
jgi:hypothetical protein